MAGASPWSVKGITAEERELAKQAARRAGVPIGQWLSRQIREAAEQERAERVPGRAAESRAAPGGGSWRGADPATPEPGAHSPTAAAWRSAMAAAPPPIAEPPPPYQAPVQYAPPAAVAPVVRPAPPSIDPARVRDLERRLDELPDVRGRLQALETLERRLLAVTAELSQVGSRLEQV